MTGNEKNETAAVPAGPNAVSCNWCGKIRTPVLVPPDADVFVFANPRKKMPAAKFCGDWTIDTEEGSAFCPACMNKAIPGWTAGNAEGPRFEKELEEEILAEVEEQEQAELAVMHDALMKYRESVKCNKESRAAKALRISHETGCNLWPGVTSSP